MEQLDNPIEFRQATCRHGFTKAGDAQFELVDSLLVGRPVHSFPELSLLPTFRRQWHSSYAAIGWRTCGIGMSTAGRWSPAFVSVSIISTGHCPAYRPQSAATDGGCWPAWPNGNPSWAVI
jgi:hypothetical protein